MRAAFYLRRSTEEHQQESLDTRGPKPSASSSAKGWTFASRSARPRCARSSCAGAPTSASLRTA
jgi:hypothetical protein